MGYAGNLDPDFIIPTAITDFHNKADVSISRKSNEYDFYIGNKAIEITKSSPNHKLIYPMRDGLIDDWDLMEKYWHQSIYQYLKADPQEHYVILVIQENNLD